MTSPLFDDGLDIVYSLLFIHYYLLLLLGGTDDHFQTQVYPHWDKIGYGEHANTRVSTRQH